MTVRSSWMMAAAGALVALLAFSSPGVAGEKGPGGGTGGTLGLGLDASWATPMTDGELGELRGGFAGLAFSVFFSGTFDSLGNATGTLDVDTTGTFDEPAPEVTVTDTNVLITAVVGEFQGASGIFLINQVPGSFNVVNLNMFIQISIINVLNGADAPSLQSLLSSGI